MITVSRIVHLGGIEPHACRRFRGDLARQGASRCLVRGEGFEPSRCLNTVPRLVPDPGFEPGYDPSVYRAWWGGKESNRFIPDHRDRSLADFDFSNRTPSSVTVAR